MKAPVRRIISRRAIELTENLYSLRGGQKVELADGTFGVLNNAADHNREFFGEALDLFTRKEARIIMELQLQRITHARGVEPQPVAVCAGIQPVNRERHPAGRMARGQFLVVETE